MKRSRVMLLKTTNEKVHIISTPFTSKQGRSLALRVAKACERSDLQTMEFCYNPNEDCPQTLDVSWLETWMAICNNTVKTGGKVFVIFRSDGKGDYGCDDKGPKSLDGQAQPGEIMHALSKGCDIHWMDSINPEAAMLTLMQGTEESPSKRARSTTDAGGTSSDHCVTRKAITVEPARDADGSVDPHRATVTMRAADMVQLLLCCHHEIIYMHQSMMDGGYY